MSDALLIRAHAREVQSCPVEENHNGYVEVASKCDLLDYDLINADRWVVNRNLYRNGERV